MLLSLRDARLVARGRGLGSNLVPEQREAADSAGQHTPMRGLIKGLGREGQRGGRELELTISSKTLHYFSLYFRINLQYLRPQS